jgi:hypothetical protein
LDGFLYAILYIVLLRNTNEQNKTLHHSKQAKLFIHGLKKDKQFHKLASVKLESMYQINGLEN